MPQSIVENIDCMVAMKQFPDKFFDLAIVDPPYGFGVNMNMGRRKGKAKKHEDKDWDSSIPDDYYFDELFRCSKNQIVWGGNYFGLPANKCFIVWDKGETLYGRDFAEAEYAWASFDESSRIWKHGPNQADRIHPTQKPVALYRWLLKHYGGSSISTKILDTHLGSGSSRIAAHDMGFDFWGYELDKDYFEAQEKRFKQHVSQLTIFTP
jgi:site-specific DNA-methyltransferase (adenine-specific)